MPSPSQEIIQLLMVFAQVFTGSVTHMGRAP
jgi:hypothetical protein